MLQVASLPWLALLLAKPLRLLVQGLVYHHCYHSKPIRKSPRFNTWRDVAVIVPTTLCHPQALLATLESIRLNKPARIIAVTCKAKTKELYDLLQRHYLTQVVSVVRVQRLGKRAQMAAGLTRVLCDLTVFVDDDVLWPSSSFLRELIAPFEYDDEIGATGSGQRVLRPEHPTVTQFLGMAYLERRIFNTVSCNWIDGGLSTLSGRTSCIRTSIIKNDKFYNFFTKTRYRGNLVKSDDDKTLTRWIFRHGWKIQLQVSDNCHLKTTMNTDSTFYTGQCVRWERAKWRGNAIVQERETYWYRRHLWTCFSVYLMNWAAPALVFDALQLLLLRQCLNTSLENQNTIKLVFVAGAIWISFLSKIIKLIPLWWRHPADLKFLPAAVVFSYVHGFISVYARLTLTDTQSWGGRAFVS